MRKYDVKITKIVLTLEKILVRTKTTEKPPQKTFTTEKTAREVTSEGEVKIGVSVSQRAFSQTGETYADCEGD